MSAMTPAEEAWAQVEQACDKLIVERDAYRLAVDELLAERDALKAQVAALGAENARCLAADVACAEAAEAEIDRLRAQVAALRDVLLLPLMFYAGGGWMDHHRLRWKEITGSDEATTKVMCDTIRNILAATPVGAGGQG